MPLDISKIPSFLLPKYNPLISYEDAKKLTPEASAAHILIWCKNDCPIKKANVMMHLRYDGLMGFPGGLIDAGEDVVQGLNRELVEEIGWDQSVCKVMWDDYLCSRRETSLDYILHFFIKELSLEMYIQLEKNCLTAAEYGREVLGTVRVPLYIGLQTESRKYRGLRSFLDHPFVSNCQIQLLLGLSHLKTHTTQELQELVEQKGLMPVKGYTIDELISKF